jgi:hypothetical protein
MPDKAVRAPVQQTSDWLNNGVIDHLMQHLLEAAHPVDIMLVCKLFRDRARIAIRAMEQLTPEEQQRHRPKRSTSDVYLTLPDYSQLALMGINQQQISTAAAHYQKIVRGPNKHITALRAWHAALDTMETAPYKPRRLAPADPYTRCPDNLSEWGFRIWHLTGESTTFSTWQGMAQAMVRAVVLSKDTQQLHQAYELDSNKCRQLVQFLEQPAPEGHHRVNMGRIAYRGNLSPDYQDRRGPQDRVTRQESLMKTLWGSGGQHRMYSGPPAHQLAIVGMRLEHTAFGAIGLAALIKESSRVNAAGGPVAQAATPRHVVPFRNQQDQGYNHLALMVFTALERYDHNLEPLQRPDQDWADHRSGLVTTITANFESWRDSWAQLVTLGTTVNRLGRG